MTGDGQVVPFGPEHEQAVRALNARLASAGAPWRFPEKAVPDWLPRMSDAPVWQEYFVLAEPKEGAVHGAYALKRQEAALRGTRRRVGSLYWPLSEGTINPSYALVASRLIQAALKLEPLLFLIGIGGAQSMTARLLRALGWCLSPVPFYFKALHPTAVLRRLSYVRKNPAVAKLLDLAAATGIGWLSLKLAHSSRGAGTRRDADVRVESVDSFGAWTDPIWAASAPAYSFVGVRDATVLNATYPAGRNDFLRVKITRGATPIGWAVLDDKQIPGSENFGDLQVGTILDCLAQPADARAVMDTAAGFLAARGVDVLITNQSHQAWRRACVSVGFVRGPTTLVRAMAPELARLVSATDPRGRDVHVNRGDGDGPWGTDIVDHAPHPTASSA